MLYETLDAFAVLQAVWATLEPFSVARSIVYRAQHRLEREATEMLTGPK